MTSGAFFYVACNQYIFIVNNMADMYTVLNKSKEHP